MFHRALRAVHAMTAALGLSLCAAVARAAPDDEPEAFDSTPASVLQSQGLQPSPPAFDLRVSGDGAGAMRAVSKNGIGAACTGVQAEAGKAGTATRDPRPRTSFAR